MSKEPQLLASLVENTLLLSPTMKTTSWFYSPCYTLKQKPGLKSPAPGIISSDSGRKDKKHNSAIFPEILNSLYL